VAFTLLQVGSTLKSVNAAGALSAALTLPAGITLYSNRIPRFARFKQYVVVVNTPSRPLLVSATGVVYPLSPFAPNAATVLSGTTSGTLSGTYLALQTYQIKDILGNIITESDYSPAMTASVAISAKKLNAVFPVSSDTLVNATALYRTTSNGGTYFPWATVDGNTLLTYEDAVADAALGLVERPARGLAPDLTLIAEWEGRLWGVDRVDVDNLRFTEAGTSYGWSALNTIPIPHVGSDAAGIVALIPRRNALGVARHETFVQITGTELSNFTPIVVNGGEQLGCVSQETAIVYNDVAYFLWRDGVYKWDSDGISSIVNGTVRSWFTTDTYFNRAMFWLAFAQLDPVRLKYRLFLASAGSTVIDRWVEYDFLTGTWYGPHLTSAFNPTCAVVVMGSNQQPYAMIGSLEGYLSQDQETKNDWTLFPIALSVQTRSQDMGEPDREKYFGELSVNGQVQTSGTISITPTVGEITGSTAGTAFSYDMTAGRQRLGRLGVGKQMSLLWTHATLNEDVMLYGYEIDPVNEVGRR
jgi:hypothetical protein